MRSLPSSSPTLAVDSPAASLGKHLRWQVLLACFGLAALVSLLGYSTYSVATVLVPDRGGVFREGVAGNPKYLNPLYCEATDVDQDLCTLLYRGLTRKDKHGRVVPDLAQDWTVTPDGKVYTVRLRTDQYWHDGRPVTADDVIFTLGILQDPTVLSNPDVAVLWRTTKIQKVDDYTVQFIRNEPYTPFMDSTEIGLLPKHIYEKVPAKQLAERPLDGTPIGTGPLMIKELAADHVRLEPNPFYGGKAPYLSALELDFYPDYHSLFNAFMEGKVDGISGILPADLLAAQQNQELQWFSSTESDYVEVVFNLNNPNTPFFQDKAVRQALYYGLDRKNLINTQVAGQGVVANSLMLPEHWAYNPNIPTYDYDAARASQMLEQAGWVDSNNDGVREKNGTPLQFVLLTNDDATHAALIEQIARDWQKIGVHAVPKSVSFADLILDMLPLHQFDAALIELGAAGDPDPYTLWHSTQTVRGGSNFGGWNNEEADQIMEKGRTIVDEAERRALYWRFQEIFSDELPALLLYYPVYTYGVHNRVHNVQIGSLNRPADRFANFADWYIVTRRVPANQIPTDVPPTPPGQ